ncbi:MAG: hypothetical protein ABI177_10800 [Edaphobacter sp.]
MKPLYCSAQHGYRLRWVIAEPQRKCFELTSPPSYLDDGNI